MEIASLPFDRRLIRYRQFAEEAFRQSYRTNDAGLRAGYLGIAASWNRLADEIEKVMSRIGAMRAGQTRQKHQPDC